jgi:hypothetical protein
MSNQKKILLDVAKRHGLTISQAEEVWQLFGNKLAAVIGDEDKKTDGLFDPEKFPVIHIDNFGKFIPNQRKIRHANHCINLKLKKDGHHTGDN